LVPRGAPNLVCTTFAAHALLDLDQQRGGTRGLTIAASAADYLVNELYRTDGESVAGFSYPAVSLGPQVHNANLLGAALLCRVHARTRDRRLLGPALEAARYAASRQRADGSWHYGEAPTQRWVDNFHTGYNLCALRSIARLARTGEFDAAILRGFAFYRAHFFREDGAVRYFHDRTYPIDIHSVAQSIITLMVLRDLEPDNVQLARAVFRWAMDHMWDDRGYFYYRVLRFGTIKTPYMRWSQAWMLAAMSTLLSEPDASVAGPQESYTAEAVGPLV
jgi:rhamnogalacturonyl hydrolase YesR